MGFDITLHPISIEEIRRFIFDPVEGRSLVEDRVGGQKKKNNTAL